METRVDEIAERVYRLSTYVPSPGGAAGFTFNQFLIALANHYEDQLRRALAG